MKPLEQFWQAMEKAPGLTAVKIEWQSLAGPDYPILQAFLRPNGALGYSYPCPLPGDGCGCRHRVVRHGPEDIVAVCQCLPRRCEPLQVSPEDTHIYEINIAPLVDVIASALGVAPEVSAIEGLHATWQIATSRSNQGLRIPLYLTIQTEPDDLHRVTESLLVKNHLPFLLLTPTFSLCQPRTVELLHAKGKHLFALTDIVGLEENTHALTSQCVDELLSELSSLQNGEPSKKTALDFFPTPSGANWEDVIIRFIDGHTVSIRAKDKQGTYNYTQMGMADKRNGNPTKHWKLLEIFADELGQLTWESPQAHRRLQKQRERLADNLKHFFSLPEDPFKYLSHIKGWQARFTIQPE